MSELETEKDLMNRVELGLECQRFLATRLGEELSNRCRAEHEAAMTMLLEVDCFDHREVSRLQLEARVPLLILQFLDDVFTTGQQAEDQIQLLGKE